MTGESYLLEIPIHRVRLGLRIEFEDPLRRPGRALILQCGNGNGADPDSLPPALARLHALVSESGLSQSVISRVVPTQWLLRDAILGRYWPMHEINTELGPASNLQIKRLDARDTGDIDPESNVSEIVSPILGRIAGQAGLERAIVSKHSRVTSYDESELEFIRTRIRLETRKNGGRIWIHDEGPFLEIVRQVVSSIPGFEPIAPPEVVASRRFKLAPEIDALSRLRGAKSSKQKIEVARKIATELPNQIERDTVPRLESVHSFVGSSRDMWTQAKKVISSSEGRCLLLSSFTNEAHSEFASGQIREACSDSRIRTLIISVGEPDRTGSSLYMDKSKRYISDLMGSTGAHFSMTGGVAEAPTHAKVVVSDTGMVFITTCNLLSSDPSKFVLESGFLIEDAELANKIIELVLEESWVPRDSKVEVDQLRVALSMRDFPKMDTTILREKMKKTLTSLKSGGRKAAFGLVALDNQLQKVAERPRYRLIKNLEHRDVLIDSAERFYTRLVLASDGLKEKGLDKATIKSIVNRCKSNKKKWTIQIWWGRDAPDSRPYNEEGKRGRKQARSRLEMFRQSGGFHFYPEKSNKPMQNHAKLIIVDDMRVLLTSDNLLSFGDTESSRGDAGELGILIDQPRISRYTRGQMELWLPKGRNPNDLTRWCATLSEEVALLTQSPFTPVHLDDSLERMVNRVLSNEDLLNDWRESFEGVESSEIMQRIMNKGWNNGGIVGLVHASGKGATNFRKIKSNMAIVSLAGNPIWRELNEAEEIDELNIRAEQRSREEELVLSSEISPEKFSKELLRRMKNSNEWGAFTGPYSILIFEMPEFNLKARGIKPTDYLQQCTEWIENKIGAGNHSWIRRRRG